MSVTVKFNPSIAPRKTNIYTEEYFSGADCNVYVDGKLCENVAGISFQLQEQLKPIYGYASRTYDDVAIGNRLVTGVLQIPLLNEAEASLTICGAGNSLDLRIKEIDSQGYSFDMPVITNNFEITPVPDWVKAWLQEYGYSYPDQSLAEANLTMNGIYMNTTLSAQQKLSSLGYELNLNGSEDLLTEKAITSYQMANGLNMTGTLTKETFEHLQGAGTEDQSILVTVLESVNVQTGPGAQYSAFYTIAPNEQVIYLRDFGDYSRIRLTDKREGYVLKSILEQWIVYEGGN